MYLPPASSGSFAALATSTPRLLKLSSEIGILIARPEIQLLAKPTHIEGGE